MKQENQRTSDSNKTKSGQKNNKQTKKGPTETLIKKHQKPHFSPIEGADRQARSRRLAGEAKRATCSLSMR